MGNLGRPPFRSIFDGLYEHGILSNIRNRLLFLLLIVLVPVLLLHAKIYHSRFKTWHTISLQMNLEVAQAVGTGFDSFVRGVQRLELCTGTGLVLSQPLSAGRIQQVLDVNKKEYPEIDAFSWADPQGNIVASSRREKAGRNIWKHACFHDVASGRDWALTDLLPGHEKNGGVHFAISCAIKDGEGNLAGVMVATVLPEDICGLVCELNRAENGSTVIVDSKGGEVCCYPETDWDWETRGTLQSLPLVVQALKGKSAMGSVTMDRDGTKRMIAFAPMRVSGWVVGAGQPEKDVMRTLFVELTRDFALLLLVGLGTFLIALSISRTITIPAEKLRNHARTLGRGELDAEITVEGPVELRELAGGFNSMANEMRVREQTLHQSEKRYRMLFEDCPVSLWEEDLSRVKDCLDELKVSGVEDFRSYLAGRPDEVMRCVKMVEIRDVNRATLELYQADRVEDLKLEYLLFKTRGQDESYDAFKESLIAISEGKTSFRTDTVSWTLRGERICVRLQWSVAPGCERSYSRVLVSIMDITEAKLAEEELRKAHDELEQRVRQRTDKLLTANRMLKKEIRERRQAETALLESEVQLRSLSARLLSAQEEERKKIAGDLHDSIGSYLGAINFALSAAISHLREGDASPDLFENVLPLMQHAIEESRRIMTELRPSILDDLGIVATVNWFCRQFEMVYTNIRLDRSINVDEDDIPEQLKIIIFRILQEAMHNAAKYSKAGSIKIGLKKVEENRIELSIEDDGVGFDVDAALSGESGRKGLGLMSMRERAELSGGTFKIYSGKPMGTRISASWHF